MQLNQGFFLQNGRCGYVLQPEFMRNDDYNPYEAKTLENIDSVMLSIWVSEYFDAIEDGWILNRELFSLYQFVSSFKLAEVTNQMLI